MLFQMKKFDYVILDIKDNIVSVSGLSGAFSGELVLVYFLEKKGAISGFILNLEKDICRIPLVSVDNKYLKIGDRTKAVINTKRCYSTFRNKMRRNLVSFFSKLQNDRIFCKLFLFRIVGGTIVVITLYVAIKYGLFPADVPNTEVLHIVKDVTIELIDGKCAGISTIPVSDLQNVTNMQLGQIADHNIKLIVKNFHEGTGPSLYNSLDDIIKLMEFIRIREPNVFMCRSSFFDMLKQLCRGVIDCSGTDLQITYDKLSFVLSFHGKC